MLFYMQLIGMVTSKTILVPMLSTDNTLVPRIAMGFDSQRFKVVLDSTYTGFWISKQGCQGCGTEAGLITDQPSGQPEITQQIHGTGKLTCEIHNGDLGLTPFPPSRVEVCAATFVENFNAGGANAFLGLATPTLENQVVRNLLARVDHKMVALYWDPKRDATLERIGHVGFGAIKDDLIGWVRWVPASDMFDTWTIAITISFFNADIDVISTGPVVISTSNSESYFESVVFNALINILKANKESAKFTVNYEYVLALPKLTLRLGQEYMTVHPIDLVRVEGEKTFIDFVNAETLPNVLGTRILSRFALVFDYDNRCVGFGEPIVGRNRKI